MYMLHRLTLCTTTIMSVLLIIIVVAAKIAARNMARAHYDK